jgi:hypothetical protein
VNASFVAVERDQPFQVIRINLLEIDPEQHLVTDSANPHNSSWASANARAPLHGSAPWVASAIASISSEVANSSGNGPGKPCRNALRLDFTLQSGEIGEPVTVFRLGHGVVLLVGESDCESSLRSGPTTSRNLRKKQLREWIGGVTKDPAGLEIVMADLDEALKPDLRALMATAIQSKSVRRVGG